MLFLGLLKSPSLWWPHRRFSQASRLLTNLFLALSRDRIALVFPESETQEAADFKGQQPGSPVSGTPRLWSKSALSSSPPRAFGTPVSPVMLQVHFRKYRLAVWCPPLCCGLASAPPSPLSSSRAHPTPALRFHGSGRAKP